MVTSELVADSIPFSDLLSPTSTVPKLKFEGVTLSCPAVLDAGVLFGMAAPPPQASCSAEAAISSHKGIACACSSSKVFSKSESGVARDRRDMNLKTWGPDTSVTDLTRDWLPCCGNPGFTAKP